MEATIDLNSLFQQDTWDNAALDAIKEAAFADAGSFDRLRELLASLEGSQDAKAALKAGICHLLLSDPLKAASLLQKAAPGGARSFHLGLALRQLGRHDEAAAQFAEAASKGADALECDMQRALCQIHKGDLAAAGSLIDARAASAQSSAHWHFSRGRLHQEAGEFDAAMESYEAALKLDQAHPEAMFHLAYLLDLYGNDEEARELYLRSSELPYVYANALINLAIIHEDNGEYERAAGCLRRVLNVNPAHERARLYLKDVLAADEMYIDDSQLRAQEKRDAVLDIPVTDFELSVRSRNCLKKMNINTLGDLLRITEAELLAYKNFGETSLREIKAMLAQKGLSLGQNASTRGAVRLEPVADDVFAPAASPEQMSRSVNSMQLSVRSRKCLQRLGINTVGDLVSKSQEELLESRNFGQTSLKEIIDRLAEMGFTLRQP